LTGGKDNLEIFSFFRTTAFTDIDEFYALVFSTLRNRNQTIIAKAEKACDDEGYLSDFPFYTRNDRIFRYIRDFILDPQEYEDLNFQLMRKKGFDWNRAKENLWLNQDELRDLSNAGHIIGLHSHSHPTKMSKLERNAQKQEYQKNRTYLSSILPSAELDCMSHPCGDYNADTLSVLGELGVKIGFRSNMADGPARSRLEIPREDHANIYREMTA
jgi:peptidoglycan/xylan/chitin deacetylase (PgdA/CDA1 family)